MDKYDADFFKFLHSTMVGYWNWENSFANQSFCSHFDIRADVRDIAEDTVYSNFLVDTEDLINVLIYGC
jgi:hypothetical protein